MQDFFNEQPVIAGIILFVVISVLVVTTYLLVALINKKSKKKKKNDEQEDQLLESIEQEEPQEEIEVDNHKYYFISFDNSGNLIIINEEDDSINYKPTKDDFYSIINSSETRLSLPLDKVWISIDESNNFKTSSQPIDQNLYIYKNFLRFMSSKSDTPWAISKFA